MRVFLRRNEKGRWNFSFRRHRGFLIKDAALKRKKWDYSLVHEGGLRMKEMQRKDYYYNNHFFALRRIYSMNAKGATTIRREIQNPLQPPTTQR